MCWCITNKKRKCKNKANYTVYSYGLEIPTCFKHRYTNPIRDWSLVSRDIKPPKRIYNFLNVFDECKKRNYNDWLSVQIAFELEEIKEKENILNEFFKSVFKRTHPAECSICYEVKRNTVNTRCNHVYCRRCITKWCKTHSECPMCRKFISGFNIND